jgi:hypothetical protein
MAKLQLFLPFDCSTVTNYKAWAMGIGSALSTLGWTKTTDSGQVNWSNVTSVVNGLPNTISGYVYNSSWTAGTAYVSAAAGGSTASVVTNSGLTYICILNTQIALTQALQNSSASLTITAVGAVAGGTTTYTVASGVTSSMAGQQFVVSGGSLTANNTGTFICVATSGTTSIALSNPGGTAQASVTGSPTAVSSTSVLSFFWNNPSGVGNAFVGYPLVVSMSGSGNSGTFTVTSSSNTAFAVTATGTNTVAAGTATVGNQAPASDTIHWLPYNYEVWKSGDSLSTTNPIFIRLLYLSNGGNTEPAIYIQIGGGQTSGTGFINGANVMNAGTEIILSTSALAQGNALFECDFSQYQGSFGMFLWRSAYAASQQIPCFLAIDRAKDNFGNDLDTYEQVLVATPSTSDSQVIFKPSAGSTMPFLTFTDGNALNESWTVVSSCGLASTQWSNNGAFLPVFPILGYVANPCLQAGVMLQKDAPNGVFVNTVLYGTEHTYLVGWLPLEISLAGAGTTAICLRWD